MDLPVSARPSNDELNLGRLNSEDFAGTEDVEVSAGRFRADRYRLKLGGGRENTVWMSADVAPLGLLRMHAEEHSPELQGSAADMELVGQGTGARPTIVKAPRPYDRDTYARETMAAWKWQP
jgi:hypothetical protein